MYSRIPDSPSLAIPTLPGPDRRSSPSPLLPLPAFSTGTTATSTTSTLLTISGTGGRVEHMSEMIRGGRNGYSSGSGSGTGNKTAGTSFERTSESVEQGRSNGDPRSSAKYSTTSRTRTITGYSSETATPIPRRAATGDRGRRTPTPPLIDFVTPASPPDPSGSGSRTGNNSRRRTSYISRSPSPPSDRSRSRSPSPPPAAQSPSTHVNTSNPQPSTSNSTSFQSTTPSSAPTKLQELLARMQKPIATPEISPSRFRTTGVNASSSGTTSAVRTDRIGGAAGTSHTSALRARRSYSNLRNGGMNDVTAGEGSDTQAGRMADPTMGSDHRTARRNGTVTPISPPRTYSRLPTRSQTPSTSTSYSRTPGPISRRAAQPQAQSQSQSQPQSQIQSNHLNTVTTPRDLSPIQGRGIWRDGRSKNGFPPPSPSRGALRAVTPEEELPEYLRRGGRENGGNKMGYAPGQGQGQGQKDAGEEYDAGSEEVEETHARYTEPAIGRQTVEHDQSAELPSRADATFGSARRHAQDQDQQGRDQLTPPRRISYGNKGKSRELLVDLGSANGASSIGTGTGGDEQDYVNGDDHERSGIREEHQSREESDSDDYLLSRRRIGGESARTPRAGERRAGRRRESVVPLREEEEDEEDSPPPRIRIRPKRRSEEGAGSPEVEQTSQRRSPNPQLLNYLASHPEPPSVLNEPVTRTSSSATHLLDETPSQAPSTIRGKKKWVHSSPQTPMRSRPDASGSRISETSQASPLRAKPSRLPSFTRSPPAASSSIGEAWASPSMVSFARGIEERADRTAQSVDFEASVASVAGLEDMQSETEEDGEEEDRAETPLHTDEPSHREREERSAHHSTSQATPVKSHPNTSRSNLTPRPPTPESSPIQDHRSNSFAERSSTIARGSRSKQSSLMEGSPFKTARTSPVPPSVIHDTSNRIAPAQSTASPSTSGSRKFRPFIVQDEADLPDLPVPDDPSIEIEPPPTATLVRRQARQTSLRESPVKADEMERTPSRPIVAPDMTSRTPHPPGAWVTDDRKVRFSPAHTPSPARPVKEVSRTNNSPLKHRQSQDVASDDHHKTDDVQDQLPREHGRPRSRPGNTDSHSAWRETLRDLKRDVGNLAVEKPLPETPLDTPSVDGEDPTFSSSIAEIEARLVDLADRAGEHDAREKVEVATQHLRNGIAALAGWNVGDAHAGNAGTASGVVTDVKTSWIPYIGKRAFYAWAVFRLVVALSDRDVNQFDPFLLSSPQQPFLQAGSMYDVLRDTIYAAKESSGMMAAILTNSGVLDVFLRSDGMIARRLPV